MNHPVGIFKADQKPATTWEEFLEQWEANENRVEPLVDAVNSLYGEGETFTGYAIRKNKENRAVLLSAFPELITMAEKEGFRIWCKVQIIDIDFYGPMGREEWVPGKVHLSEWVQKSTPFNADERGAYAAYSTPRGCRVVWDLDESRRQGLGDKLDERAQWAHMCGQFVDPRSLDWTREYRLPRDHYGFQRIVRGA